MTIAASLPSESDIYLARNSSQILAQAQIDRLTIIIKQSDGGERELQLPAIAIEALNEILIAIGQGQAVQVLSINSELTIPATADLLNVSPSYLVTLLDEGQIPADGVGDCRRIRYQDAIDYRTNIDITRRKVLDELVAEAQALNLGYE